jgi:hypothetical protein
MILTEKDLGITWKRTPVLIMLLLRF